MREIKTERYLRKEAIYSNLPVGDPGLPGNMTERDIPSGIEPDEADSQTGETVIEVDWPIFSRWFEQGGESLPPSLSTRTSPSYIQMSYKYSYDYNDNIAYNIKITRLKDHDTAQMITDPYLLESFGDYFEGQIKNDIEIGEEDVKLERSPDYNPFEE